MYSINFVFWAGGLYLPNKFMLCYVMLCYVMLCYVMLCYVMLCYVMLCYVMLCYSISSMLEDFLSCLNRAHVNRCQLHSYCQTHGVS